MSYLLPEAKPFSEAGGLVLPARTVAEAVAFFGLRDEVPPEDFAAAGCAARDGGHCDHLTWAARESLRFCCMCRAWTLPLPLLWEGDDG